MRIDFHAHIFPPSYIEHLAGRHQLPYLTKGGEVEQLWYGPGVWIGVPPASKSVEVHLAEAAAHGIDLEVLSITLPGVDTLPLDEAVLVARRANEEIARMVQDHPGRLVGLATVPLQDVRNAIAELERAVTQLGLKGAAIYSNVAGRGYDSPAFFDFFAAAAHLGAVLFLHPTYPAMAQAAGSDPVAMIAVAFRSDTGLAITQLILSGVLEKFPSLKIVFAHLGGTFPYLAGFIDYSAKRPGRYGDRLSLSPSDYLRRTYLDTVCRSPAALRLAQELVGLDHLLFATDYPYNDMAGHRQTVEALRLAPEDQLKVFESNARRLLGL